MAQQDYNTPQSEVMQQEQLPRFEKKEDASLPAFAKDVPIRTMIKKHGSSVLVEYEWNVLGGEEIKISMARCKGDDNLQYVHKIKIKDGAEVGTFRIADTTYIIRKTSEDIAKELMKTSGKLKASVLEVIGYFKTTKGNVYTVSKVEKDSWSLDKRLGLKTFSLDSMKDGEKRNLSDMITEELVKLCKQGYALKDFSPMDVIVTRRKIVLGNMTALVKVGATKTVDSFLGNLKVMVKGGISKKEDVTYGIALSFGAMKDECAEWNKERGMGAEDELAMMNRMEKEILESD